MFTHLSIYKPFAYHLRRFPNQKIFCYASCFHGVLRFLFLSVEFIILITWFAFLFWHPYSSSYVMNHFYVSPPFVFPRYFLASRVSCLALLCLCVHVCMALSVCVCMHICWHGAPEEEGRPRRRRTPRFLLKPWPRPKHRKQAGPAGKKREERFRESMNNVMIGNINSLTRLLFVIKI